MRFVASVAHSPAADCENLMAPEPDPALTWGKRLAESGVPQLIEQVHELVGAELDNPDGTTASIDMLFRVRRIATTAVHALDRSDPTLISDHVLGVLSQNLSPALNWLTQWRDTREEAHLQGALNHLDAILSAIADIPTVELSVAESEVAELRESARRARQSAVSQITALREQSDQAAAAMEDRVRAGEARVAELQAEIDNARHEHGSLLQQARQMDTARQEEFYTAERGRISAFDTLMNEQREGNQQLNEELRAATTLQIDAAKQSADMAIEHLEAKRAEADALVGLIGEEALVGSYESEARHERRVADRQRAVSVFFVVVSVVLGFALLRNAADLNWTAVVARTVLLAPLGAIAAYSARQSSEHRHAERDARHLGLQLKAFGPYLQHLPDQVQRDEIVKTIATRIFGQPRPGRVVKPEASGSPTSADAAIAFVREVNKLGR